MNFKYINNQYSPTSAKYDGTNLLSSGLIGGTMGALNYEHNQESTPTDFASIWAEQAQPQPNLKAPPTGLTPATAMATGFLSTLELQGAHDGQGRGVDVGNTQVTVTNSPTISTTEDFTSVANTNNSSAINSDSGRPIVTNVFTQFNNHIFAKTWWHYQSGNQSTLTISSSELDFSFINRNDIEWRRDNPNIGTVNLFSHSKVHPTALALGSITVERITGNIYEVHDDYYDFDIRWGDGMTTRNTGTALAGFLHGPGFDGFLFMGSNAYIFGGPFWIKIEGPIIIPTE